MNRMKYSILILLFCSFSVAVLKAQGGQTGNHEDLLRTLQREGPGDQVNLEMDSLLVSNYNKLITSNKQSTGVPGYRLRIFSESGVGAKQEQQKVRAKFLSLYPGLDAYNRYDEPYFKVYVGDCRTKSEALKLKDMIERNFPNSFVMPSEINLKSGD